MITRGKITIYRGSFEHGYIMAALWTFDAAAPSGDYSESGRFGELFPLIADETLEKMGQDCVKFESMAGDNLADYPSEIAGHDFWLTRNRHGSGFWENDHGTEDQCKRLTELSHSFGETDLYYGDDGKIYS